MLPSKETWQFVREDLEKLAELLNHLVFDFNLILILVGFDFDLMILVLDFGLHQEGLAGRLEELLELEKEMKREVV